MSLRVLLVLSLLVALIGCGTLAKKAVLINPGDDKAKVLEVMGPPGDRQFKEKNEAWQYCENDAGFAYDDYRIIWFYDQKVVGLTSYKKSEFGFCSAFFKSIQWENAPNMTVEVRER
jgi:hypothetical protein